MVRFTRHDRPRPRNYFSRREQWRLMLLILPLGLVIIVMARLRDPIVAQRIDDFFASPADRPTVEPIADSEPRLQPGTFRGAGQQATAAQAPPTAGHASTAVGLFPGVQPEWLKSIKDNSYFRNAEKEAWFNFFRVISGTPDEQLKAARGIEADYIQLVDQPDFYRGKLVTVYGYVRQVSEQTPAENALGIKNYYRIVVQPTDGSYWPIFVYCVKLPPNLQTGENGAAGNMKVTGLFFKKLSYPWENGLGTAPVIVANTIEYYGAAPCGPGLADIHPPTTADAWNDSRQTNGAAPADAKQSQPGTSFRDLLVIAGWDVTRLAALDDGKLLSDEQRSQSLELLRRLRTFRSGNLEDWAHDGLDAYTMLKNPGDYRGQLVRVSGRVTKVTRHALSAADAERLEMRAYYECQLMLDNSAGTATIVTGRVPNAWLELEKFEEPASAVALYVKRIGVGDDRSAVWLAKEIAWHPGKPEDDDSQFGQTAGDLFYDKPDDTFGKAVLGAIGMDVGLFDVVEPRGKIRAEERDAFYRLLRCMKDVSDSQLVRFAQNNLPSVRKDWERQLFMAGNAERATLAKEVVSRAAEGRYSVAPLFNDPERQVGRLFVFDGAARRCVRVEVGDRAADGAPIDAAGNFGIDHYYELHVFTDDSQNYPLVFCMRGLPSGFPTGASIHVPVRVAGFFFKDWLYRTRGPGDGDAEQALAKSERAQFAPLLIGRSPIVLEMPQGGARLGQYVAGGIFVLALAGICAAAVIYARGDRRFRERVVAASFSPPPGQSLNDLQPSEPDRVTGADRREPPLELEDRFAPPEPPEGDSAQLQ
jgi:hypothetical protein